MNSSLQSTRRKFPARLWLDHPPRRSLGFHILELSLFFGIPICGLLYVIGRSRYRAKLKMSRSLLAPSSTTAMTTNSSSSFSTNSLPVSVVNKETMSNITSLSNTSTGSTVKEASLPVVSSSSSTHIPASNVPVPNNQDKNNEGKKSSSLSSPSLPTLQ